MAVAGGCVQKNLANTLIILGLFVLSFGMNIPNTKNDGSREVVRDVVFTFRHSKDLFVGQDFDMTLRLENHSTSKRTLPIIMAARTKNDNGVPTTLIKEQEMDVMVKPKSIVLIKMKVKAEDYEDKLNDQRWLEVTCMATVIETGQIFTKVSDLELRKP
ncbi:uncharacterized protein LOC124260574 [Haliotis rubra]|uniref:uncharacterized protein LOC124260574 n=1 Tax=Haliotis rubra TaxID=36100 RepID=UPI001EE5BD40|nr:uncharacterized protein LOC124260574 [Haliotis rubra]